MSRGWIDPVSLVGRSLKIEDIIDASNRLDELDREAPVKYPFPPLTKDFIDRTYLMTHPNPDSASENGILFSIERFFLEFKADIPIFRDPSDLAVLA